MKKVRGGGAIDHNRLLDLAVANSGSNNVSVLLNRSTCVRLAPALSAGMLAACAAMLAGIGWKLANGKRS